MSAGPGELRARAAWSRLVEPGDVLAGAVVSALGPVGALDWLVEAAGSDGSDLPDVALPGRVDVRRRLRTAVERWGGRLAGLDADRDLDQLHRSGGTLLVPGTPAWPAGLDDLGPAAPMCLWTQGALALGPASTRSVAVIGARASSAYGEHMTGQLAGGLASDGWLVVSGGAYGIDAVAHRAALAGEAPTVAVLAGGVDRAYPAGNARLFRTVVEQGGALVSEVPPGSLPTKSRFLQRNRLIAAMTRGTVVVEAAWRSGALNTAATAARLLRPVGAVPGPATSATSAGCHRLIREGAAVCVTDAAEVRELVGVSGADLAETPSVPAAEVDGLDVLARRALDALPLCAAASAGRLAVDAGLTTGEMEACLGVLELAGLASRQGDRWVRRGRENGHTG